MAEGFLGRWSQRKQAVRTGQAVAEPVPEVPAAVVPAAPAPARGDEPPSTPALAAPEVTEAPAPPTLDEAQSLTPQSDFRRFVAADVDPEVKHVAMRKLFADPHFNVMDGLDIYIDDYNKPDPLPAPMLRKLASAQFLGLVEEEKPAVAQPRPLPPAEPGLPPEQAVAAGPAVAPAPEPDETPHHDDPDLRLQQDHASGPQGPGRGAG